MLAKLNVKYVIVGHSERRELFGETDEIVAKKLRAVLGRGHDADPLRRRDARGARGRAPPTRRCSARSRPRSSGSRPTTSARCVVAYEPIWAIGTGRNATPDDANATIGVIREHVRVGLGDALADGTADPLRRQREAREHRRSDGHARDRRRPRGRGLARPRRVRPDRPVRTADGP